MTLISYNLVLMHDLIEIIHEAVSEPDPATSNHKITLAHYQLSESLHEVLRLTTGANYHSWAVWGSLKAGITIRQEGLADAIRDAMRVAGFVGLIVGLLTSTAIIAQVKIMSLMPLYILFLLTLGSLLGTVIGVWAGRAIASISRARAAVLILEGNRMVLEDIGGQTARFITTFAGCDITPQLLEEFLEGMVTGPTHKGGQALLQHAFRAYAAAATAEKSADKAQITYFANCLAILHEHIRLQPYITSSLPWIIRRCVTKRMMDFNVANLTLSVAVEPVSDKQAVLLTETQKETLLQFLN